MNSLKIRVNGLFYLFFCLCGFCLISGFYLYLQGSVGFLPTCFFYGAMAFLAASYFSAREKAAFFCLAGLGVLMCLFYLFTGDVFSAVDEAAHYYYANYIAATGTLPNMVLLPDYYETVHPPLYYLLCSLFCLPVQSKLARVFILRGLGLLLWAGGIGLTLWGLKKLEVQGLLSKSPTRNFALTLLFWATPGVMVRFCTISNEGLCAFLCTAALLLMLNLFFEEGTLRRLSAIVLVIALAALTKITALFLLAPLLCVLLAKKRGWQFLPCLLSVLLLLAPWLWYNLQTYGALTGTAQHLLYVLPLTNPSGAFISPLRSLPRLFAGYFYPQEVFAGGWMGLLLAGGSFLVLLFAVLLVLRAVPFGFSLLFGKLPFGEDLSLKKKGVFLFFALALAGNVAALVFGTLTARVDVMLGRYLYLSAFSLIGIGAFAWDKLQKSASFCRLALCAFSAVLQVNVLQQFLLQWLSRRPL